MLKNITSVVAHGILNYSIIYVVTLLQKLNPYTIPLESINLIEASAGTGKSWTVTYLFLRLILEKGLTIDQILVVTFTDAATKELRDAVRTRLIEALTIFELSEQERADIEIAEEYQKLLDKLLDSGLDKEESISRLRRAKLSIDEAAIFTIHSFCQRALSERAFEANLPFESELLADDSDIMQRLVDDFWRRRFSKAPASLIFKLQQKRITPDSLLKDIRSFVGKPYLKTCGSDSEEVQTEKWVALEQVFQRAIEIWNECEDEIKALLNQPELNEKGYLVNFKKSREASLKELNSIVLSKKIPSKLGSKLAWLGTKKKLLNNFEPLEHPFFEQWQHFLDAWALLDSHADDDINRIRIQLLDYLREELPKEKQRLGVLSFDDLLLQLESALQAQPQLADDLRNQYRVAMIDEFQDTDPIQYTIFNSIFSRESNSTVFFVGDPKQAIYSFRGGDIHTYLKAKDAATQQYTLDKNWRSHPKLIDAFNALYRQSDNPFMDKGIQYQTVSAGDRVTDNLITPDARSSLRFWNCSPSNISDDKLKVEDIRKVIANAVAGDIASLLNAANEGKAMMGDSPIVGGDIAVLIRSHAHGDLIKKALNKKGIVSVQSSKDSIYETHEASEILSVLIAIVEPQREDEVRRALVTELLGYRAEDLLAFDDDSSAWEDILVKMQDWHFQWKNQGFLPMMRSLMKAQDVHQRLLSYDDGERRLTNVLHLAELIHHQSKQRLLSMEEVLRWLQQQKDNINQAERELRLESDDNLVKIVTIHKSKGLEYPLVYLPFVGMKGAAFTDKIYSFHNDDEACLEIGSSESTEHKEVKVAEEKAEEARLLYVALTRAKYQCTVVTFSESMSGSPDRTALGWLLTNGKVIPPSKTTKAIKEEMIAEFYASYNDNLKRLVSEGNGNISLCELPVNLHERYQSPQLHQNLSAKTFSAEIKSQAQITSFSGLTAGTHDEKPDHDSSSDDTVIIMKKPENEFPRGATAGTALHEIYENLDFIVPVREQLDTVSNILDKWGFDLKHQNAAIGLMENSLQTELFEDFSLGHLSKANRLDEMEFYLPLERLQIDDLKQILFKYLPQEDQLLRHALDTLNFEQVEGYLKGFIDLIFEHKGIYYIADYKSNSLADYDQKSLIQTMADSHYYLQYLLYSVALHRYLKKRVANYQWDTHVGGAYYLFIRGMTKQTGKQGVYFNKPSLSLINALDDLFMKSFLENIA